MSTRGNASQRQQNDLLSAAVLDSAQSCTVETGGFRKLRVFLDYLKTGAKGTFATVTDNAGQAVFNAAGHSVVNGDTVTISGTTNYDGTFTAVNVVAGVSFELGQAFVATESGSYAVGATAIDMTVKAIETGVSGKEFSDVSGTSYSQSVSDDSAFFWDLDVNCSQVELEFTATNGVVTDTLSVHASVTD
jgi:hypothetical protein